MEKIILSNISPEKDGYYLVRFSPTGGLHLVLIQTLLDGSRQIVGDMCPFASAAGKKKFCPSTSKLLKFHEFPSGFWAGPIQIEIKL